MFCIKSQCEYLTYSLRQRGGLMGCADPVHKHVKFIHILRVTNEKPDMTIWDNCRKVNEKCDIAMVLCLFECGYDTYDIAAILNLEESALYNGMYHHAKIKKLGVKNAE